MQTEFDHIHSFASPPLVIVSVLNWNTPELTLACLHSLRASTWPHSRVVVVDNASCDDSIAKIQAAEPAVTIIRNDENFGFAAGHARALEQARLCQAQAIWLVNSDAIVAPDALDRLVQAWKTHGDAIYGGLPLQRRDDGQVMLDFPEKFLAPDAVPGAFRRDRSLPFDANWRNKAPLQVGAVSGSTLFLPLALIDSHGWMDAAWFMYCEEMDYCYRLRAADVPCWLVPTSHIWHVGAGSQLGKPRVTHVLHYYRARNEILLAQRHAGSFIAIIIAIKKILRGLVSLPANPRLALYILRGARDGFRGIGGKRYAPESEL